MQAKVHVLKTMGERHTHTMYEPQVDWKKMENKEW